MTISYRKLSFLFGGEGETRTPAPVTRPTPLAGAPRHQLEYFSLVTPINYIIIYLIVNKKLMILYLILIINKIYLFELIIFTKNHKNCQVREENGNTICLFTKQIFHRAFLISLLLLYIYLRSQE